MTAAKPKKRIALFLASFFGRGVARIRINLCEELLSRGYQVDLVVANGTGALRDNVPAGVNLIDLKASRLIAALPGYLRYIRDVKPDAIISAQDHVNIVALIAWRLARSDVPISVSVHNLHRLEASRSAISRGYWMQYFVRWIYPWATARVAVSSGLGDDMAETTGLPRDSITTVFNPVVTQTMLDQSRADCPHPWLEDGQPPVIIGVGQLTFQKDFETLIRAFDRVRKERDVRLMILGTGFREEALHQFTAEMGLDDVVKFTGYVDNPFVYMRRASLFVLSSIHEGLPGVLIQAMACGCPVVSTDCPHGPKEILRDGAYGPLVPIKDDTALARAMIATLDSPTPSEILETRSRDFEIGHIVDQYAELLGFQNAG